MSKSNEISLPHYSEVVSQLRPITWPESLGVVLIPLFSFGFFFLFCFFELYFLALLSVMYLSFATYGSCSHELVHENTKFSKKWSHFFLSLIEFLMLRSGTVYKHVHLNHHRLFPNFKDDPEGQASYYSFFRTLLEGPILHFKLIRWAYRNNRQRVRVTLEIILILLFLSLGFLVRGSYPELLAYQVLVYMGSWLIPLVTSYLVHRPYEAKAIYQTRVYRGLFFRLVAFDHLYHLEHHLYPKVPHHRWPDLARILNPHFKEAKIIPRRLGSAGNDSLELN